MDASSTAGPSHAHPVSNVQLLQNLFMCGKPERFVLAVNQFAVQLNIKNAALALDKIHVDLFCLPDRGRQTGGLGCVVSHDTIRDLHLHSFSPSGNRNAECYRTF